MFSAVSRAFPNVTIVRVRDLLTQLADMLQALANGIEIASMVKFWRALWCWPAPLRMGIVRDSYDAVVLKVLGATRGKLARIYAAEYGLLGVLSGLAALPYRDDRVLAGGLARAGCPVCVFRRSGRFNHCWRGAGHYHSRPCRRVLCAFRENLPPG